jgi:hypothetical protein
VENLPGRAKTFPANYIHFCTTNAGSNCDSTADMTLKKRKSSPEGHRLHEQYLDCLTNPERTDFLQKLDPEQRKALRFAKAEAATKYPAWERT